MVDMGLGEPQLTPSPPHAAFPSEALESAHATSPTPASAHKGPIVSALGAGAELPCAAVITLESAGSSLDS